MAKPPTTTADYRDHISSWPKFNGKTWRVSASAIRELSKASQSEASDGLK